MTGLPLACIGLLVDSRIFPILLPFIIYVALISNLGHKEWRFIIYTVPAFNVAASSGLRYLYVAVPQLSFDRFGLTSLLQFNETQVDHSWSNFFYSCPRPSCREPRIDWTFGPYLYEQLPWW